MLSLRCEVERRRIPCKLNTYIYIRRRSLFSLLNKQYSIPVRVHADRIKGGMMNKGCIRKRDVK
jgi:hypothetical protein